MKTIRLEVHKLSLLRPGDRILSCGATKYATARVVSRGLGKLEVGGTVEGVRLEPPRADSVIEWVLYPSQCDGLSIVIERDAP